MSIHTKYLRHTYMAADGDSGGGGGFFSGLFGGGGTAPTPPAAPTQAPNAGAPSPNPPSGTPEPSGAAAPDPTTLDGFAQLLLNSQASTQGASPSTAEEFDLSQLASSPDAFQAVAQKLDFTANLPPDIAKGIEEGDAKALMGAVQHAARQAYTQALQHSAMLAGKSLNTTKSAITPAVNQQVASALKQHALQSAIPKDAHPATGLVLNSVAQGLMNSVPGMSPEAAAAAAKQLLRDMGTSLEPKDASHTKGNKAWDDWMTN